jgi:Asp-tRNA(Asn)/Glu-tRNA(Gln) amidotransferase A subunit family amidase
MDKPVRSRPNPRLGSDLGLSDIAGALRRGDFTASDLIESSIDQHVELGVGLGAYKHFDADGAREAAAGADTALAAGITAFQFR